MHFDVRVQSNKSTRDRTLIKLFKSPAIMTSRISTIVLSSDPSELCDRLRLLLREKKIGKVQNVINQKIVAIVDNLLE